MGGCSVVVAGDGSGSSTSRRTSKEFRHNQINKVLDVVMVVVVVVVVVVLLSWDGGTIHWRILSAKGPTMSVGTP